MEKRPVIKLELSLIDKIIEILSYMILGFLLGLTGIKYSNLPNTIPIHYNFAGQVDGYGNKITIVLLPIIGTIIFIVLTILNKFPHLYNYPTDITTENALKQYTYATRIVRYIKFITTSIFSFIVFETIQIASGESQGFQSLFLPLVLGLTILPLIYFGIKSYKAK